MRILTRPGARDGALGLAPDPSWGNTTIRATGRTFLCFIPAMSPHEAALLQHMRYELTPNRQVWLLGLYIDRQMSLVCPLWAACQHAHSYQWRVAEGYFFWASWVILRPGLVIQAHSGRTGLCPLARLAVGWLNGRMALS